jgi:hypothetical protein
VRLLLLALLLTSFIAQAATPPTDYVKATGRAAASFRTYGNWIDFAGRKSDRDYLRKELREYLNSPVKVQYVDRDTLSVALGSERISIKAKDLATGRFEILKREFKFDPKESAEAGVKRLSKILNQTARANFIEPEAQALAFIPILASIWLVGGAMATYECASTANTLAWCAGVSFGAPLIAAYIGIGAVYRMIYDKKDSLKELNLELSDIHCSDGVKPMSLVLTDKDGRRLATEVYFTEATKPDRIEVRASDQEPLTISLSDGWNHDSEKPMSEASDVKIKTAQDVSNLIQGMKDLNKSCRDPGTRVAIEKLSELREKASVPPLTPAADAAATNK